MMSPDELATLANIFIKADLCQYEGSEWKECINDLQKLIAGRVETAYEILARLRNDNWECNVTARCLMNFYLELNLLASNYIDKSLINILEL